jgi:hypothetical protein
MMNGTNENLVGTADSPINPMLAPLADNGSLTKTRALLPKSPAINAGKNASAINPVNSQTLQFDQRNLQRIFPSGGVIDIGAFEFGATSVPSSASPDLRNENDTGLSSDDNITKAAMPVFNVLNAIPGYLGCKFYGLLGGILAGLVVGISDSTIGWALSSVIKPYISFEQPDYTFPLILEIIASVSLGASIFGLIGALLFLVVNRFRRVTRN